jgi:hypothetical protein
MDGMIMDIFGGYAGIRHDWYIFQKSQFNSRSLLAQILIEQQYKAYSDKGYHHASHLWAAFLIRHNSPQWHRDSNRIMSRKKT